jgi:thiol-disulfide isomerase/thioredoxin
MKNILILIIFFVFPSLVNAVQIKFQGTISDQNKKIITNGEIVVINYKTPWDSANALRINQTGKFIININGNINDLFSIKFKIPEYYEFQMPFFIEDMENYNCSIAIFERKKYIQVNFTDSNSFNSKFNTIYFKFKNRMEEIYSAYEKFTEENNPQDFRYDISKEITFILTSLKEEKEARIRELLYFYYIGFSFYQGSDQIDRSVCKSALSEISPLSPIFSLDGNINVLNPLSALAGDYSKYMDFMERMIKEHAHPNVRAELLFEQLRYAQSQMDNSKYKITYYILINELGKTDIGTKVKNTYKPSLEEFRIVTGKTIPDFSFVSIDNPNQTFTNKNLEGKIYLIDFWATWCVPCVAGIPYLHKAYEKYKKDGFEILSISYDEESGIVQKFRKNKWDMPWLHTIPAKELKNKVRYDFEVSGFPRLILVDREGKIIAVDKGLHKDVLDETLAKIFNNENN